MTLEERIKTARDFKNRNRVVYKRLSKCKQCGIPFNFIKGKEIQASGIISKSLCVECFNDPLIPFEKVLNSYSYRATWSHEEYNEHQVDLIIESLVNEAKTNPEFQYKYNIFIMKEREKKLEKLFTNEEDK